MCVMQIAAVRLLRTHELSNFAYASKIADRSARFHLRKTAVTEGASRPRLPLGGKLSPKVTDEGFV